MSAPYPWQQAQWQSLSERLASGRLPHALLFSGPAGLGKGEMARAFAHALLCEERQPDGRACGQCRSCQLLAAGSHPDLLCVQPPEAGKAITVDLVRGVAEFQALKGQYSERRVILLQPADALNINAANALLKTLEEPTPGTVLLLVTSRPMALLPTIRSRCQTILFQPVNSAPALQWLAASCGVGEAEASMLLATAAGAPLRALALNGSEELAQRASLLEQLEAQAEGRGDTVAAAEQLVGLGATQVLEWWSALLTDLARLRVAPTSAQISHLAQRGRLQALAERVDLAELHRLAEQLLEAIRWSRGQINMQLTMEELLLRWRLLFRPSGLATKNINRAG